MTVTVQTPFTEYTAAPGATTFATSFRLITPNDLVVKKNGAVITSGFTVSGYGQAATASVIFTVPMVGGEKIQLRRVIKLERQTNYQFEGDFQANVVNEDYDRLWMSQQDQEFSIDENQTAAEITELRNLRAPVGETLSEMPNAAARANKLQAYDSTGNPIFVLPGTGTASDVLIQLANQTNTSLGAALLGYFRNITGFTGRTVSDRLSDNASVEDFYKAVDLGKIDPAVNRMLAAGYKTINFSSEDQYIFANPIVIDRAISTSFRTKGDKSCELVLNGANDIFFDVGNAATVRFGFHLHNMVLKKQNSSTTGAVIRMRNFYNWTVKNTRVYGEYKFWRWLDAYSTGFGKIENNLVAGIRREMGYFRGGSAPVGSIGSTCIQNQFDYNEVDGAHDDTALPADQGIFLFDDYCEANWLINTLSYRSHGYLAYFKGSPASLTRNVLNMVINPNHEATLTNSGLVRVGHHAGGIIGGHGWSEGNNIPAIQFDAPSVGWDASNMQLALKGAGAVGVLDNGIDNLWVSMTVKGVDTAAQTTAVAYKTGATAFRSKGQGRAYYLGAAYQNLANDTAALDLDIDFHSINTAVPISGLSSVNNYNIRSVVNVPASAFIINAATLTIPVGTDSLTVVGAGAIAEISAGTYYKQRVLLRLTTAGQSVVDINVTTKNIILSVPGSTFTSSGRSNITLEWNGDYWWEVARTA
jgi:hypothetical protein